MAKTELKKPKRSRKDCFANVWGLCGVLKDNEFDGRECRFFKTKEQYKKEIEKAPGC